MKLAVALTNDRRPTSAPATRNRRSTDVHRWHAEVPRTDPARLEHQPALEGHRPAPTAAEDVVALQGHVVEESTLARRGAEVLWEQLHDMDYVNSLGALTGNQAVQQVRAGLKAIYLSGLAGRR